MAYKELKQFDYPFGVLRINKAGHKRLDKVRFDAKLNSDILENEIKLIINEDSLVLERLGIDYVGKTRSFTLTARSEWRALEYTGYELPLGIFIADEVESTFDRYVFYFEDIINNTVTIDETTNK